MISKNFNCIFIHIPKTAGQSIEHFFLALHGLSWQERSELLLRFNPEPSLGPERLAHLTAWEYLKYGYVEQAEFNRYFKFAFIRNPWERLVSEFYFYRYDKEMTFKHFVFNALPEKSDYTDKYRHILPQYDFIYDKNGNQLVDFIGRFETLEKDFNTVCKTLKIKNTELPHVKPAAAKKSAMLTPESSSQTRSHYSDYYDEETKDQVARLYEQDILTFHYEFQNKANC